MPGLIVGAVLVFTGSFTAYATPQLLGGERQMVMGTLMYQRAMVAFDWVEGIHYRRHHGGHHHCRGAGHDARRAALESDGDVRRTWRRINPVLIVFTLLVYVFLMGPLIIVFGAALSGHDLTFPRRASPCAGSKISSKSAPSAEPS